MDVFARIAYWEEVFGVRVSLYSSEKEALCAVLNPEWNRTQFPQANTQSEEEKLMSSTLEFCRFVEHRDDARKDYQEHLDSMNNCDRSIFRQLLQFVHDDLLKHPALQANNHQAKIVNRYTGQPPGCNGVPMLVFGLLKGQNMAANSWVARLPLEGTPKIVLPKKWINPQSQDKVSCGKNSFCPLISSDFLNNRRYYIDDDKLRDNR